MEVLNLYKGKSLIAGCDEVGRGSLAGPVFAAAVIFPDGYYHDEINDSKKITEKRRCSLSEQIKKDAVDWAIASADVEEIDKINILQASILAMHRALDKLKVRPDYIIVDGNRFNQYEQIPYVCFKKADSKFFPVAAASILAKTARDDLMKSLHKDNPLYSWDKNKGYPSKYHIKAVNNYGQTIHHRRSFKINRQYKFDFCEPKNLSV